jgi:nuclear receptor subfamily 2 group C
VKSCWGELFALGLAQCSKSLALADIFSSIVQNLQNSVVQDSYSAHKVTEIADHISKLHVFVNTMHKLNVSDKEYAYLKLISLLNPGTNNRCLQFKYGLCLIFTKFEVHR